MNNKNFIVSLAMGALMILSSILTVLMTPSVLNAGQREKFDLETIIPKEFNNWTVDLSVASLLVSPEVEGVIGKIYDQTLSRTYINKQGVRVMLSIAYGGDQSTDLHIHRPEVCYASGGFNISKKNKAYLETAIGQIPVMRMVAKLGIRNEPITYWVRVGDSLTRGWFEQKLASIRYGLSGQVPDGLLFRVSTISNDEEQSYFSQKEFLTDLLQAVQSKDRHWLVGQMNQ